MRFGTLFIAAVILLTGCSSLPLQRARSAYYSGNLSRAEEILGECSDIPGRDSLLCYMEKGLILHYMGKYEESTRVLLKAVRFLKDNDIISISGQSAAVMINDRTLTYKGEYSERLWIHTYLMMNFLMQYKYESALVEAKQALEVYDSYPDSLSKDFFTRALVALCYENMGHMDDARIEYEKLSGETGGGYSPPAPLAGDKGELVLFIGQGHIPPKVSAEIAIPPSIRISIPRYADSSPSRPVTIRADGSMVDPQRTVTDTGEVAGKSLKDRAAQYLTRQALRAGTKEAIAREVGEKSEVAEVITRVILFLSEEADTRSWETLPGGLTMVRIPLEPGIHNIEISSGYSGTIRLDRVDIPQGGRTYRSVRL